MRPEAVYAGVPYLSALAGSNPEFVPGLTGANSTTTERASAR